MAAPFKKTSARHLQPRVDVKVTPDTLYWKNLDVPVTKKEYGAITDIDFCPTAPHYFAVTNSTRVQVYSPTSLQIHKTISRFKEVAYSGSFRSDGKLLVAGGDEGSVRLFDVDSKSLLRLFKGHSGAIHVTKFLTDKTRIFSGSDDNSVSVWDIPSESQLLSYREHQDYVRCGIASASSTDLILTGSYDHTVKLFDTRINDSVMTFQHGHPVESVLMFPNGGICLSAGGNYIKVWDLLQGGRLLSTLCHHHKTVTSLAFCNNFTRILSGSVDRHIKIFDISTYKVVHTLDLPGTVLSAAVSPDDDILVVGMAEGLLSIQKRKTPKEPTSKNKQTSRYNATGKTYQPQKTDFIVHHKRKEQLERYDKYFKKFEFTKALDAAMKKGVSMPSPEVTVRVLQELMKKGAIKAALACRSDLSVGYIIQFIKRNISKPSFQPVLLDVADLLLDLYAEQVGQSPVMDCQLTELRETVEQEVNYMTELSEVMGMLDTVFASAAMKTSTTSSETVPVMTPSAVAQAADI
ncbi:U3 small nucleolar RNA-associated protein 15 homolog [Crassostrea angulata]|uniref:U3 small nucleolar RNA-associated protein 15 homolog n=1 Tax=Magallana gigas TaxID=29159 RepID=K1QP46_MAGGI|nr:U3 small nucleolar RNA-associated protein 15 homolog [Crassostrea angulata]|eukprot:XP_011424663.1 PREDICTED: U3 small nucleolar RNA-associated protein 15 homolog [Crassostrea gigas]